jgi:AcrR family transcriptional regulator
MRPRDEIKEEAIREKAIEMIVEVGLDGLSMQKLAKAAGVSPATIYIYYKDREDLLMKLYVYYTEKMFTHTLEGFDPDMHFEEGMRVQWKNRAKYFLANPKEMFFMEQCRHSPIENKVFDIEKNPFKEAMKRFVQNALKRNELNPLPFEVYWAIAYAPLYQLLKFHMQGKTHQHKVFSINDDSINKTLELVLKALKPSNPNTTL